MFRVFRNNCGSFDLRRTRNLTKGITKSNLTRDRKTIIAVCKIPNKLGAYNSQKFLEYSPVKKKILTVLQDLDIFSRFTRRLLIFERFVRNTLFSAVPPLLCSILNHLKPITPSTIICKYVGSV